MDNSRALLSAEHDALDPDLHMDWDDDDGMDWTDGPKGWWNLFRATEDGEVYVGSVPADEGPDDMGCDIYPKLAEAGWLDDEDIEAAEADGADTVALAMRDGSVFMVYYSAGNIECEPYDYLPGECRRYMDIAGPAVLGTPGWQCCGDCTSCAYNDGHNTCSHPGVGLAPLEN